MEQAFRFSDYSVAELHECATRFITCFRDVGVGLGDREWTRRVHAWFSDARGDGVRSFSHHESHEFMLDLCHMRFPPRKADGDYHTWEAAIASPDSCSLLLALESEWGSTNVEENIALILDDAHKLAVVRSRVKVMIFSSHVTRKNAEHIRNALSKLRLAANDTDPWLTIDIPWSERPPRHITGAVFADR